MTAAQRLLPVVPRGGPTVETVSGVATRSKFGATVLQKSRPSPTILPTTTSS
jgi:hypothetical protein